MLKVLIQESNLMFAGCLYGLLIDWFVDGLIPERLVSTGLLPTPLDCLSKAALLHRSFCNDQSRIISIWVHSFFQNDLCKLTHRPDLLLLNHQSSVCNKLKSGFGGVERGLHHRKANFFLFWKAFQLPNHVPKSEILILPSPRLLNSC